MTSVGNSSSPFVPSRASEGAMATSGWPEPAASAASAASIIRSREERSRSGRSAGRTSTDRAPSRRAAASPSASPSLRPPRGLGDGAHGGCRDEPQDGRVGCHDVDPDAGRPGAQQGQRLGQHAQHELLALLGVERLSQACLAAGEGAQRDHRVQRVECRAQWPGGRGVGHGSHGSRALSRQPAGSQRSRIAGRQPLAVGMIAA